MAATSPRGDVFFLIPKISRASAPVQVLWEWIWEPEVKRWQARHRVGWDATDASNEGAERPAWKTLFDMEKVDYRGGEMDLPAITLVLLHLAKALRLYVVISSIGAFSLKDALRSRSTPSQPSSLGQSGVACWCTSCVRTQ